MWSTVVLRSEPETLGMQQTQAGKVSLLDIRLSSRSYKYDNRLSSCAIQLCPSGRAKAADDTAVLENNKQLRPPRS